MEEVQLKIDETKRGAFVIEKDGEQIGEMKVHLEEQDLIVDGTVINKEFRGKDLGKKLLDAMIDHARKNNYKVVPVCPYAKKQLERHAEEYADILK
jgi:uncharacterized protein